MKSFFYSLRPSYWLGLLLATELISFFSFVGWHVLWPNRTFFDAGPPELNSQGWVTLVAAAIAMMGWIVNCVITLRNSIKQHTINTLLQARLSTKYMEYVEKLTKNFSTPKGEAKPLTMDEICSDEDTCRTKVTTAMYILNYFEFIAIGIRRGDLDESMLRQSLRSILMNVQSAASVLIEQRRNVTTPPNNSIYENFMWLHKRWMKKTLFERICG